MAYKGMNHYEVGATQGHSKEKVDSMIKSAKKEGKALVKKESMARKMVKLPVKDEGYGNISHLAKTVKRGKGHMKGVSHWTKDEKDKGKEY